MPAQIFVLARRFRRLFVTGAVGLMLLQALVAGLATAHAASLAAAVTIDASLICHSAGGAATDEAPSPAPAPDDAWHACCAFCMAQMPALADFTPPGSALMTLDRDGKASTDVGDMVPIAPRAVRAGLSQAPPISARA